MKTYFGSRFSVCVLQGWEIFSSYFSHCCKKTQNIKVLSQRGRGKPPVAANQAKYKMINGVQGNI